MWSHRFGTEGRRVGCRPFVVPIAPTGQSWSAMKVSRRRMITMLPPALALAACAPGRDSAAPDGQQSRPIVDVRDFGALGDGVTDESSAIEAAVAALRPGSILRFPKDSFRFARRYPPGNAAIALTGISHLDIEFEPGAELVMDNLDPDTGAPVTASSSGALPPPSRSATSRFGGQHGHPARWVTGSGSSVIPPALLPHRRDGTDHPAAISDVHIADCEVPFRPEASAILLGVSDCVVERLHMRRDLGRRSAPSTPADGARSGI